MNLKEFAENSGVVVSEGEGTFKGTFEYYTKENSNSRYVNHKSEELLYKSWLKREFTNKQIIAINQLLSDSEELKQKQF
jgi:hypothetical protein